MNNKLNMLEYKYGIYKLREAVPRKIAWLLPKKVAYWAAIRVIAHATTGEWGNQVVPDLLAMDALKRWNTENKEINA